MDRIKRSANRSSLSLLVAALMLGLALLIPAYDSAEEIGLATVVVIVSFAGCSLLGL